MLYILKIRAKVGVVPQSFGQNQNPVQGYDFTLDFNTRTTFYTIEDTHQILCRFTDSFETYGVQGQNLHTYGKVGLFASR